MHPMTDVRSAVETLPWGPAPEASTEALRWLEERPHRIGHYIGGHWTAPGDLFAVINPATSTELAQVSQASTDLVNAAVAAARNALPAWQAIGGHGRARWLYAISRAVQRRSRLLAVLE